MTKVLVADDDTGLRALLTEILEGEGYDVVQAPDGKEAWKILKQDGVDLAVLDVNMPGLTGFDLARRIRRDPALKDLPILLLTVRAKAQDQIAGYDRGADDYLSKPFERKMLVARLKLLERRILRK